jgi:hypothetical protein
MWCCPMVCFPADLTKGETRLGTTRLHMGRPPARAPHCSRSAARPRQPCAQLHRRLRSTCRPCRPRRLATSPPVAACSRAEARRVKITRVCRHVLYRGKPRGRSQTDAMQSADYGWACRRGVPTNRTGWPRCVRRSGPASPAIHGCAAASACPAAWSAPHRAHAPCGPGGRGQGPPAHELEGSRREPHHCCTPQPPQPLHPPACAHLQPQRGALHGRVRSVHCVLVQHGRPLRLPAARAGRGGAGLCARLGPGLRRAVSDRRRLGLRLHLLLGRRGGQVKVRVLGLRRRPPLAARVLPRLALVQRPRMLAQHAHLGRRRDARRTRSGRRRARLAAGGCGGAATRGSPGSRPGPIAMRCSRARPPR